MRTLYAVFNIGYHICFTQECSVLQVMFQFLCKQQQKHTYFTMPSRWTGWSTYIGGFKVKYNKCWILDIWCTQRGRNGCEIWLISTKLHTTLVGCSFKYCCLACLWISSFLPNYSLSLICSSGLSLFLFPGFCWTLQWHFRGRDYAPHWSKKK